MAYRPRTRKRVHAIRRAIDGSAFENCDFCGVLVAISLADMHECESKKGAKRFKGDVETQSLEKPSFDDQPRSPFCVFMESFKKSCNNADWIDIDREGFETWKNMSNKERGYYGFQAERVNFAYQQALLGEVNDALEVDDEADSAMVGKVDQDYKYNESWEYSEGFENPHYKRFENFDSYENPHYKRFESFDSYELRMVHPWIVLSNSSYLA